MVLKTKAKILFVGVLVFSSGSFGQQPAINHSLKKSAEKLLGHKITNEQALAIEQARVLGRHEPGLQEGLTAFAGAYTEEQLARKDRILESAGFSEQERLALQSSRLIEDVLTSYAAENLFVDNVLETPAQVQAMNDKVLAEMGALSQERRMGSKRKQAITALEAQNILSLVIHNPVAYMGRSRKYDPRGRIGFCFGRAMTAHLELLAQGVDKTAIRKVFIVGQMKAVGRDIIWQFHTATVVKNTEGGWWVIDPLFETPVSLPRWYKEMKSKDVDGKLRLYATEAGRFAAHSAHSYEKLKLLDKFYNDYFKDLLKFYKKREKGKNLPQPSLWTQWLNWMDSFL